ncbi:MAG: DUF255 domain-containing protein [Gammaproteobacteria bacterium]|nr:DUF255 domain-containing protein [Gammaproteobacteria bacterium]
MGAPTSLLAANSLAHHPSPYLSMHANDPVDWRVWDEAVLRQAQDQNKLIYISVGYFSCHWCHVMQRQSYSDSGIAELLNQGFVPVKVDRELRPELDRRLINFVRETRGAAGWPLNVFLTPEGYPVLGFTYLPKADFNDVLVQLQQQWQARGDEIALAAKGFFIELQDRDTGIDGSAMKNWPLDMLVQSFVEQSMSVADELQGGFGETSKFPQLPQLLSLMNLIDPGRESSDQAEKFIHLTLRSMAEANLVDHINGGFFRYTIDPDWQTPHYEKMLYDNAQMVLLYLRAENLWPNRGYRQIAEDTLQFIQSKLLHPGGGYVSSLSAVDVNSQEGGGYLWTRQQLAQTLSGEDFKYLAVIWQLDQVSSSATEFLARPLIGPGSRGEAMRNNKIRLQLQTVEKPAMPIDDKRLASWNALMLQALVAAASFDEHYLAAASRQFDFMSGTFLENGNLVRFAGNGMLAETTFEDYAFVSLAFLQYGQAFKDPEAIRRAHDLATRAYQRYFENDRWHLNNRSLIPGDPGLWIIQDTVLPSALTAWLSVVMSSSSINPKMRLKGNQILHRVSQSMVDTPYYYGSFILLRQQFGQARNLQAMAQ